MALESVDGEDITEREESGGQREVDRCLGLPEEEQENLECTGFVNIVKKKGLEAVVVDGQRPERVEVERRIADLVSSLTIKVFKTSFYPSIHSPVPTLLAHLWVPSTLGTQRTLLSRNAFMFRRR